MRPPPSSTLFPYTTLFRSLQPLAGAACGALHPPLHRYGLRLQCVLAAAVARRRPEFGQGLPGHLALGRTVQDRKSTRLNSSHLGILYAVFCLKKKNKTKSEIETSPMTTPRSPRRSSS